MNYLFSGENSALKKLLTPKTQKYIATAINIAPLILSCVSALLAIAVVKLFRTSSSITGGSDIDSGTDSAISFLLGLLFSVELGTRLFSVVAFQQQLKLTSDLMPKDNRDLIYQITTTKGTGKVIPLKNIDLKDPNFLAFLSALYGTAGLNTMKNATHLRWVLFDLTVFYHVVIRTYAIAGSDMSDMSIFATAVSASYMHYFIIMMMFSTTDSIYDIYHTQPISDECKVPSKNAFACIKLLLTYLNTNERPDNISCELFTNEHYSTNDANDGKTK